MGDAVVAAVEPHRQVSGSSRKMPLPRKRVRSLTLPATDRDTCNSKPLRLVITWILRVWRFFLPE